MTTPAITPPSSRLVRAFRGCVCVVLALALALFAVLAAMVVSPAVSQVIFKMLDSISGGSDESNKMLGLGVVLVGLLLAGVLVWFGRKASGRVLSGVAAIVTGIFLYLGWDAPAPARIDIEKFFPRYPQDDASYAVLMRYGKNHPAGRDFRNSNLQWKADTGKPDLWVKFVTENRAQIEADWVELAPLREWWAELNTFEHVVDLMPPHLDAEILAFRPLRELTQRTCAIATLRALDGQGDEAIATLLPLIEVNRKLQLTGRTLVIQIISLVAERMALDTVVLVLDRSKVSPAMRARLRAVLAQPGGGEAGARRLLMGESIVLRNTILERPSGSFWDEPGVRLKNLLDPILYNRHHTVNLYAPFAGEMEEIIARRELSRIEPRTTHFLTQEARPAFKNIAGRRLLQTAVFNYEKVTTTYWKIQDARAALLARVNAPAETKP